jgi:ubiquinone/menaquinone biosynthesis C-methylase UbiE
MSSQRVASETVPSASGGTAPAAPTPDLAAVKARQQAAWASGDYAVVGTTIQIVAELLVEAVDPRAGQRCADVAAGSGNTALACARRGCEVVAVDYVPALLERGRRRATAEGLVVDFREGDAEALPLEDHRYDRVTSSFGVMFTADHRRAAHELLRVVKPGGAIGLANWTPQGVIGRMFGVIGRYVPGAPGVKPPSSWGSEEYLHELFDGALVKRIATTRREYSFRYRSGAAWLDVMKTWYGPMVKTFAALDADHRHALADELIALMQGANRSGDSTLVVPAEYLEVVITTK